MKITPSRINTLLTIGENLNIEFKRAGDGPKADTFESVCAFLNKAGGDLLLGVNDDGTVVGLPPKSVDAMIRNFVKVMNDPNLFEPTTQLYPEHIVYKRKHLIYVHVPESPEVHRFKGATYVRVHESDVRVKGTEPLAQLFIRKQHVFTEQRVFPYVTKKDMRLDLLPRIKEMTRDGHPWRRMSADAIFKSAKLMGVDAESGKKGFKAAAVLLLGSDDCIGDVFPAYKTDALLRRVNVDRYDDRVTVSTNLLDSYDQLCAFGEKHLLDKFYLEDDMRVSLRDKILREMIGNLLIHREFSSARYARFIIERDRMYTENANRAFRYGRITPKNLEPEPKNPIIANFFHQIRLADELGSGVRNLYHYVKIYSNAEPVFDEDDVFRLTVPLDDAYSADRALTEGLPQTATAQDGVLKGGMKSGMKSGMKGDVSGMKTADAIIALMRADSQITHDILAARLDKARNSIIKQIAKLKKNGLIRRVGPDKGGHWEVIR